MDDKWDEWFEAATSPVPPPIGSTPNSGAPTGEWKPPELEFVPAGDNPLAKYLAQIAEHTKALERQAETLEKQTKIAQEQAEQAQKDAKSSKRLAIASIAVSALTFLATLAGVIPIPVG